MGQTQLGRMQFRIMQVLWDRGRASAREITDALNEAGAGGAQHGADAAAPARGEGGGRPRGDRADLRLFPRLKEDKVKRTAARDLLERVFGGNVGSLVAHLLKNERLSRTELDELQRLIDQRDAEGLNSIDLNDHERKRGAAMGNGPAAWRRPWPASA